MTRCRWRLCRAHAGRLEARRRHVSVPSERSGRARHLRRRPAARL